MTRLMATDEALGCWNTTVLPAPMLKLCQLTPSTWLSCCTVMTRPLTLTVALPLTTLPCVGNTSAAMALPLTMGMVKNAAAAAALINDQASNPLTFDDWGTPPTPLAALPALPLLLQVVISATGTSWPVFLLKTKRKILAFILAFYLCIYEVSFWFGSVSHAQAQTHSVFFVIDT